VFYYRVGVFEKSGQKKKQFFHKKGSGTNRTGKEASLFAGK
jgi:hypothetical protein